MSDIETLGHSIQIATDCGHSVYWPFTASYPEHRSQEFPGWFVIDMENRRIIRYLPDCSSTPAMNEARAMNAKYWDNK